MIIHVQLLYASFTSLPVFQGFIQSRRQAIQLSAGPFNGALELDAQTTA